MQDRNVINGTVAVMVSPLVDFYSSLWPFIIAALSLIIADLKFGVEAAMKRGEEERPADAQEKPERRGGVA